MQVHHYISKLLHSDNMTHLKKTHLAAVAGLLSIVVATFGGGIIMPNQAQAASSCSKPYTIVAGDTLGTIAKQQGINWQIIAMNNGIANPNIIITGQQICISDQSTAEATAPASTPVVKKTPTPKAANTSINGMIDEIFGPYAASAKHVAMCESTMNPNATNPISIGGSHAAGLFQVLYPSTWRTTSQAHMSPYNARANIIAAHEIFARDGHSWREWVCR